MSEAIEKIMEQAQVFASTWSLVGRSAFGSTIEEANEEKAKLEAMLREVITCALDQSSMLLAALEDAHRLGFWLAAIWADRDDLIAGTGSPAYIQDRATDLAALAAAAPVSQEYAELPDFDAMAIARYRVVPAHDSMFYQHAVVAGDGSQQLFIGREVECQNMARKFAGAFLDGVFVAAPAQPDTEVEQLRREIAGLRAALAPFANYEKMRSTIGGATPKAGVIWGCESKYGIAEITAEDMRAAIAALAGTATVSQEYAELPAAAGCIEYPGSDYEAPWVSSEAAYDETQMRAFADATHTLRASHGQAPASVLHLVHSAFAEIAMAFPKAFALHKVGIADTAVREALAAPATARADSVQDAARYRWLRERSSTMFVNISINGDGAEIAATLDSAVDAARKQGANHGR